MASRKDRRRKASEREAVAKTEPREDRNADRTARAVSKADSRQLRKPENDGFTELYEEGKVVKPPLPLEKLLILKEENAVHSACIDAKVADSVGRGWHLDAEDDDRESDDAKAVATDLRSWLRTIVAPNEPSMTWGGLVSQMQREREATGWGAWEVGRDGEEIAALWPIPAHTLRATEDADVFVQMKGEKKVYFKRFGSDIQISAKDGKETAEAEQAANEVLILKHYSPRTPYYGIPKWVSAIPPVAEFQSIRDYNISWFESGGTGDRIVHYTAANDDVAKQLADDVVQQLEEAEGQGHTTVVSHGDNDTSVEVEHLNPDVGKRDGQFGKRREDLVKEILIGHQVPGYRIGWAVVGSLGGGVAKEMLDTYRYGEIEPLQEDFEELLADTLFNPEKGGFDLKGFTFAFDDLDWTEMAQEIERATTAVEHAMASPNEGREMIGLDRSDDPALDLIYYKGAPVGIDPNAVSVVEEMAKALRAVVRDAGGAAEASGDGARDTLHEDGAEDGNGPQADVAKKRRWLLWKGK